MPAEDALLLYLLGDRQMTVGELVGTCYFGLDASHVVTRLKGRGYLKAARDRHDARSQLVSVTKAAEPIRKIVETLELEERRAS